MTSLLVYMLSALFISASVMVDTVKAQMNINNHWCSSCDDPHMHTFDGVNYEFQFAGNFFLMYTDYLATRVTASFRPCNGGWPTPTCNCGVHIKFMNAIMFLDTCGILPNPFSSLQFFYVSPSNPIPLPANCGAKMVPGGSETNDAWWNTAGNAVEILTNRFLCAKSATQYNTYIIRTNDVVNENNIYVKVMLHDRGISCIYIRSSLNAFGNTGGLCGHFNGDPSDDLSIWSPSGTESDGSLNSGYEITTASETQMRDFWQLNRNPPIEHPYKLLDDVCPCDESDSPGLPNFQCGLLLSECLQKSINENVTHQDSLISKPGKLMNEEQAADICNRIFKMGGLDQALDQKLITQEEYFQLKRFCRMDIAGTGDNLWAVNLVQIGFNLASETCLTNPQPFCESIKTPAKCGFSELGQLIDDGNPVLPCPNRCVKKRK